MKYELIVDEKTLKVENQLIEEKENESLTPKQSIYRNYLKSVTWKHIREKALKHYNYTCQSCGGIGKDVHHETYPSEWGQETIYDLKVLCRACHNDAHTPVKKIDHTFSHKSESIHVRAISSFLSEEQTKELTKQYPDTDLHTLLISDTPKGEEARKYALKLLNIQELFLNGRKKYFSTYGLHDFKPKVEKKIEKPIKFKKKKKRNKEQNKQHFLSKKEIELKKEKTKQEEWKKKQKKWKKLLQEHNPRLYGKPNHSKIGKK